MADPIQARWFSEARRRWHFRKHGPDLGTPTIEAFDGSARGTIRAGRRFTYQEPSTREDRVGYYHAPTRRFTALSGDEATIHSHFPCRESYIRGLPGSTYER